MRNLLVFVIDDESAAEVPSGLEEDEDEPFFQVKEQNVRATS